MKYIAQKHPKGLAIVTWCIDADYGSSVHHLTDEEKDLIFYNVYCDIYDDRGDLCFEDGIMGVDIPYIEGSDHFKEEIIKAYQFHFLDTHEGE